MATITLITEQTSTIHLPSSSNKDEIGKEEYKYAHLLPALDPGYKYPPLQPFEHVDPGHRASSLSNPLAFLEKATKVKRVSPGFGTEIDGVQLKDLTNTERDQLALAVARRGVLVFKNQQNFIDGGVEWYKEWGSYFGRFVRICFG